MFLELKCPRCDHVQIISSDVNVSISESGFVKWFLQIGEKRNGEPDGSWLKLKQLPVYVCTKCQKNGRYAVMQLSNLYPERELGD